MEINKIEAKKKLTRSFKIGVLSPLSRFRCSSFSRSAFRHFARRFWNHTFWINLIIYQIKIWWILSFRKFENYTFWHQLHHSIHNWISYRFYKFVGNYYLIYGCIMCPEYFYKFHSNCTVTPALIWLLSTNGSEYNLHLRE